MAATLKSDHLMQLITTHFDKESIPKYASKEFEVAIWQKIMTGWDSAKYQIFI